MSLRWSAYIFIALVSYCFFSKQVMAAQTEYQVITVRLWELQEKLNKASEKGWTVNSVTTSSECIFVELDRQVKGECNVVILEREK
jgi:hypothetical protein